MGPSIVHVSLVVKDYDEAIDFYVHKLNFELLEDVYQPEQDKRWVVVAPRGSRGTSLLLAKASKPEQAPFIGNQAGGRVFLFLGTDDFWRDFNDLRSKGIVFVRGPKDADYGVVAVFEDLYGNLWDLVQFKAGHPLAEERTVESSRDFEETLTYLRRAIEKNDLWLINEINPEKLAEKAGIRILPARQLLFFHPRYLQILLQANPDALIEVPLKIAIVQKATGAVSLRATDTQALLPKYPELTDLWLELGKILHAIIDGTNKNGAAFHETTPV